MTPLKFRTLGRRAAAGFFQARGRGLGGFGWGGAAEVADDAGDFSTRRAGAQRSRGVSGTEVHDYFE